MSDRSSPSQQIKKAANNSPDFSCSREDKVLKTYLQREKQGEMRQKYVFVWHNSTKGNRSDESTGGVSTVEVSCLVDEVAALMKNINKQESVVFCTQLTSGTKRCQR